MNFKFISCNIDAGFFLFNVHGSVYRNNILVHNSNKMHKSQSLFYLTTALHVLGVTITHLQEHKTTVTGCCSYSCFVLLKMGDSDARNM
jgi:hypothetical protein